MVWMESRMENKIVQMLKGISKKLQFIVVVDKTGLPITSWNTETRKIIEPSMEMTIAGIAAAVLSLGEKTGSVLKHGNFKEVIIKNEEGTTIIVDAGENALIIGILPPKTGYGSPLLSLKLAASKLRKLKDIPSSSVPKPDKDSDISVPEIK